MVSIGIIPFHNATSTIDKIPFGGVINELFKKAENKLKKLQSSSPSIIKTTTRLPNTTTSLTSTPTTSTVATTRRIIIPTRPPSEPKINKTRTHEASAAITIIIICAILIVIIVITILVLLFNRKQETEFIIKSPDRKIFDEDSRISRMPKLTDLVDGHRQANVPSNLLLSPNNNNNNLRMVGKGKRRHDVKEWYV